MCCWRSGVRPGDNETISTSSSEGLFSAILVISRSVFLKYVSLRAIGYNGMRFCEEIQCALFLKSLLSCTHFEEEEEVIQWTHECFYPQTVDIQLNHYADTYNDCSALSCVLIGAGPVGLRTAIGLAFLGILPPPASRFWKRCCLKELLPRLSWGCCLR